MEKEIEYGLETPYMDRVQATGMGCQCLYSLQEFTQFFIETQARGLRRKDGFSVSLEVPEGMEEEAGRVIEEALLNAAAGGYPLKVEVVSAVF